MAKFLFKLVTVFLQDLKLQPEDSFVLKVVQLQELLEVRHSVFVIGAAGTGKSQVGHALIKVFKRNWIFEFTLILSSPHKVI